MIQQTRLLFGMALVLLVAFGCKKEKTTVPPTFAHFEFMASGDYYVTQNPNTSFKIPIGLTSASDVPRTVQVTITSPSGAAEGAQYTVSTKSITIPAGKVEDSIIVKGNYNGFAGGRLDTLVFKITGGDISPVETSKEYTLYMQQYCEVDLGMFSGIYIAQDYYDGEPDGGPYSVRLTPGSTTGATSGNFSIEGLWGTPTLLNINLNWADPAAFTTEIPVQAFFVHPTYGQSTIRPNGKGTFSSCNNTLRIDYEVTVAAGSFGQYYTTLRK